MPFALQYSKEAVADIRALRAYDRASILHAVGRVLVSNPVLEGRSRIKRLEEPTPVQYRLRVGAFRVYYDVDSKGPVVLIRRVLEKKATGPYLEGAT